jgi:hypothetical protein
MEARRQLLLRNAKVKVVAPETGTADIPNVTPVTPDAVAPERILEKRKPRVPTNDHLKGFRLRNGDRPIILDRKAVSFVCPEVDHPEQTVIGMKLLGTRPMVVMTPFDEVVTWWLGEDAPPIPPPTPKANGRTLADPGVTPQARDRRTIEEAKQ